MPLITEMSDPNLKAFQRYLLSAKNVLCVVGAGLSASSGIPTYRGTGGQWKGKYRSIDLATPDAFFKDPSLVWQFYSGRRVAALKAKPNTGHFALAELNRRLTLKKRCLVMTQNVDGLSQRAGHENLLELHGNIFEFRCTSFFCGFRGASTKQYLSAGLKEAYEKGSFVDIPQDGQGRRVENDVVQELTLEQLPQCPWCQGLLRPGVVWFGESLPISVITEAEKFVSQEKVDLVLVIGTSGAVWPAMGYVEEVKKQGGRVAVFNTEIGGEELRNDDWGFLGDAAYWLPEALEPIIGRDFIPKSPLK